MRQRYLLFAISFAFITRSAAQTETIPGPDTIAKRRLPEVVIRAFEQQQGLLETPAAVSYIAPSALRRYSSASIQHAVNATPGVRMEERSPGSYRFNIRGSSLRSPFGVRNVKVYYNDIPFTDPGGNTYLNQLGTYNFSSLTVVKGPGSSVYGAGTGGVLLIESMPDRWQEGARVEVTGSDAPVSLFNGLAEVRLGKDDFKNVIRYQHLSSEGYRRYTELRRDVFSWDARARVGERTRLDAHFLYGDLSYNTPGALTLAEYEADPTQARPGVGFVPGSEQARAAIYQKMLLAGFTVDHRFNEHWQHTTTLYGLYAQLYNPTIRNYGKSSEPNAGGRTVLHYRRTFIGGGLDWLAGAELQQNYTTVQTYYNRNGNPDTLLTDDILRNRNLFGFTQLSLRWNGWTVTAGASLNQLRLLFARLSSPPYREMTRDFNNELAPRLALLKHWNEHLTAYATVARGFSPPTSAELSPSGGQLNADLNAEYGWNYELGFRGYACGQRLWYDVNAFYFGLHHTIVQRRDSAGGDYFINSGRTRQAGLEASLRYQLLGRSQSQLGDVMLWLSYTLHRFHYVEFLQLNNDFSGNQLPGVAPNTVAAGLDWKSTFGLYGNLTYYYSDRLPLNDANSAYAAAYHLLGCRIGYQLSRFRSVPVALFIGGDNLLDQSYISGPDINGFGGRYYNAAPGRMLYAGLSLGYL